MNWLHWLIIVGFVFMCVVCLILMGYAILMMADEMDSLNEEGETSDEKT